MEFFKIRPMLQIPEEQYGKSMETVSVAGE